MKLRRSLKALINLIPIAMIVGLGFLVWTQYQSSKAISSRQAPQTKAYQVAKVLDGDTIKLENGQSVRFCGIDAPEKSQPLGPESKANLEQLINSARGSVLVMEMDRDRYGRIVGEVFTKVPSSQEEKFLNGEQVRNGFAYHYAQYSRSCVNQWVIATSEERAKAYRKGVWAGNYERPWNFRQQQRKNWRDRALTQAQMGFVRKLLINSRITSDWVR